MEIWLVWILGTEIVGHMFPDKPNTVHYLVDSVPHTSSIKKSEYEVIEKITISKEDL